MMGRSPSNALANAIAGLAAAGLLACIGPARTPALAYYTLSVPGSPAQALPGPVQVGAFTAEAPYANPRMAYRTSSVRMEYYVFHRWAGSPQSVVAAAVRDYLSRAPAAGNGPRLLIEGHIRRLEELDESGARRGVLGVEFSVQRDGRPWLDRSYEESEPAGAATPEAVVLALSRALGRMLDRLTADMATAELAGLDTGARARTRRLARPWPSTSAYTGRPCPRARQTRPSEAPTRPSAIREPSGAASPDSTSSVRARASPSGTT